MNSINTVLNRAMIQQLSFQTNIISASDKSTSHLSGTEKEVCWVWQMKSIILQLTNKTYHPNQKHDGRNSENKAQI